MILSDIKDYIQAQGQVSLKDIAIRFDVAEDAAEEMVAHWERKGKVTRLHKEEEASCENVCGQKCDSCPVQCTTIFIWNEAASDKA